VEREIGLESKRLTDERMDNLRIDIAPTVNVKSSAKINAAPKNSLNE